MTDILGWYHQVVQGAGFLEKAHRGRLRFDGADAIAFLQALVTADLSGLERGDGRYSTYLTPQGRMLADLTILHRGDHVIADVPASRAPALAERFDAVIFTEDVRVLDVSARIAQFGVVGSRAAAVIAATAGVNPSVIHDLGWLRQFDLPEGFVVRTDDTNFDSFDLFVSADSRDGVARALEAAGATVMSPELADILRIETGRPLFGSDMTEETIPLEAGLLDRAISTSKGCYVGQEIIVRVLHRGGGRVAKRLVRIAFDAGSSVPPAAGEPLAIDGRNVGVITSAVFSPVSGRVIALGYVARDAAESGRRLQAGAATGAITGIA